MSVVAALAGWTVVRLTRGDINARRVEQIIAAMNGREHG